MAATPTRGNTTGTGPGRSHRRTRYRVYALDVLDERGEIVGVYVGQTSKNPQRRRTQHATGGHLAARVFVTPTAHPGGCGPTCFPECPHFTVRAAAEAAGEAAVAEQLRLDGHTVFGGH